MVIISSSSWRYFLLLALVSQTWGRIYRLRCSTYANFSFEEQNAKLDSTFSTLNGIGKLECQSECISDNRCKTINIHEDDLICELNGKSSEDARDNIRTVHAVGWTYYSTLYNETLIGYNCLARAPCEDGFLCYDSCDCPGYRCVEVRSCFDLYRGGIRKNGVYRIHHQGNESFPTYCDFESEANSVWTLLTSYTLRNLNSFRSAFYNDTPIKQDDPNWVGYRLGLQRMEYIRSSSTIWRATCSFPIYTLNITYVDYVRAQISEVDILTFKGEKLCRKVEQINIRGHSDTNITVKFWQRNEMPFHTDSSADPCGFNAKNGCIPDEDNFGLYRTTNEAFRCTQSEESTTQYWFGVNV